MTGLFCGVCGTEIKNLRFLKTCRKCQKVLCSSCVQRFYLPSRDIFKPRWWKQRISLQYDEVCGDCYEELEKERADAEIEEEQEPTRPITTCQICGANDEPPESKIFGYRPPEFSNCGRCGKLVCDGCIRSSLDGHYEYSLICFQCYDGLVREDEREREDLWREVDENSLEE